MERKKLKEGEIRELGEKEHKVRERTLERKGHKERLREGVWGERGVR